MQFTKGTTAALDYNAGRGSGKWSKQLFWRNSRLAAGEGGRDGRDLRRHDPQASTGTLTRETLPSLRSRGAEGFRPAEFIGNYISSLSSSGLEASSSAPCAPPLLYAPGPPPPAATFSSSVLIRVFSALICPLCAVAGRVRAGREQGHHNSS